MDKKIFEKKVADAFERKISDDDFADYILHRRYRWDEWGSPVGLGLVWALCIIPLGIFLYLIHLAGLLG